MVMNGKLDTAATPHDGDFGSVEPMAIQSFACVIGVSDKWVVNAASENCESILGHKAQDILGRQLREIFPENTAHDLRSPTQVLSPEAPLLHLQGCLMTEDDRRMDVTVTRLGTDTFYEFEEAGIAPGLATGLEQIQRLVQRISSKTALEDAALEAARTLHVLSSFDRVSVHRLNDGNIGPSLGLIDAGPLQGEPSRACLDAHTRDLCVHLHLIPDTEDVESHLLLAADKTPGPDARGLCSLGPRDEMRAALRAEGARAAMTIPIRAGGELWGLFLCHHSTPLVQSVSRRAALNLFSQLFGYEVQRLFERVGAQAREQAHALRDKLIGYLENTPDLNRAMMAMRPSFGAIVPHDDMVLWIDGQLQAQSQGLDVADFAPVFDQIKRAAGGQVIALERLSDVGMTSAGFDATRMGALVLPLSRNTQDAVVLLRGHGAQDDGAQPWMEWEIEAAGALRNALIEARLMLLEEAHDVDLVTRDQNGLLISELNHRVRNILNLTRGMISQGRSGATTVDDYANDLEARVFSLARAHDQLTKLEWQWANLNTLVCHELEDELNARTSQVRVTGTELELSPPAFTTLALLLHELTTNARRHGALSVKQGRVSFDVAMQRDGFAELHWRETLGPPALRPKVLGFGMTIIEHSIPFELRGDAQVSFGPEGLDARFRIPPGHVRVPGAAVPVPPKEPTQRADTKTRIEGAALILEDSLIIAIDAADLLRAAGATKIYSCNSVESALEALQQGDVSFALLDVNLGDETSLAVAQQLWKDGIPAVLATGYGRDQDKLTEFPPMPLLTKPYDVGDLRDVLRKLVKTDV